MSTQPGQPPVNQFGTPVNQFGTAPSAAGDPFGTPAPPGGWVTAAPAPPRRSGAGPLVAVVAVLALLAVGGVLVKWYVFPDLSKPISLPAAVAGLSQGTGNGVTLQTKDDEGHAAAVAIYLDDPTRPTQYAMAMATRGKADQGELTPPAALSTSTVGELTCTQELGSAELMQAAPQASQSLARSGLSTGAACWRTGRHFTAMGFAFSSTGTARSVAVQAANAAWSAR